MISRMQLRRLALRTSRAPELRPVLQDALLEAYPAAFESAIASVERYKARNPDDHYLVLFDVSSITRPHVLADQRFAIIVASGQTAPEVARLYSRSLGRPLVVVYVAQGPR